MFATLDQWAFQYLATLLTFLGVAVAPGDPDPNWKIAKLWEDNGAGRYTLELVSDSLPKICSENLNGYVVFPQIYVGNQNITLDDYVVYSNSLANEKNMAGSLFDRPVVKCSILSRGKIVKFTSQSYQKFFATFNSYPRIAESYPGGQFFYNSIYLIAAALCICLGAIGAGLMWNIESREKIFYFVLQELYFCLFMYAYGGGSILEIDTSLQHSFVFLGFSSGFFLFLSSDVGFLNSNKVKVTALTILLILFIVSLSSVNVTQALINICISPYLFLGIYIIFEKIKKGKDLTDIIVYFLVLPIAIKDAYVTLISRDGVSHLSILVIVVSISNFLKVMKAVNRKKSEAAVLKTKLDLEKKSFIKLNEVYDAYKEIIHDLKSPITALNFSLHSMTDSTGNLKVIANRTSEILNRIESTGYKKVVDWYSIWLLEKCIEEVISEKSGHRIEINFISSGQTTCESYFDPLDLKICMVELIDNSIKARSTQIKILIVLASDNLCHIGYSDNGAGLPDNYDIVELEKGKSVESTGLGLFGVQNKVESWGGLLRLSNANTGFACSIHLKQRLI